MDYKILYNSSKIWWNFLSVLLEKNPKEVILDFKMSKKWPKKI
jgi:hypothetical protein